MKESTARIIKDFLEEYWNAFEVRCEEQGEDAEKIIKELDNEIL